MPITVEPGEYEFMEIKILTDIKIMQSEEWRRSTVNIDDLNFLKTNLHKIRMMFSGNIIYSTIKYLILILNMRKFDVIISGNIRTAQFIGLIRKLFCMKYPKHIILEFRLDKDRPGILWNMKKILQNFAFSSVNLIVVSSSGEIEMYSVNNRLNISRDKLKYIPFHTNITVPRMIDNNENYILSAGKAGRDYALLVNAVRNMGVDVKIVSDRDSVNGINIPENVELYIDIDHSDYMKLLEKCMFVVVPLKYLPMSTGQVVILEAMALGKAVIATRTLGTVDYIKNNHNGILVEHDNPIELKEAISLLIRDNEFRKKLTDNALFSVKALHTFDIYIKNILELARMYKPGFSPTPGSSG